MTPNEFRTAIETLWPGHGGQTRAAEYWSIRSSRIREYLSGARPVPGWLAGEIAALLKLFPDGIRQVDPRRVIELMHEGLGGDDMAAASILGAAWANAVRTMGRDAVLTLIRGDE